MRPRRIKRHPGGILIVAKNLADFQRPGRRIHFEQVNPFAAPGRSLRPGGIAVSACVREKRLLRRAAWLCLTERHRGHCAGQSGGSLQKFAARSDATARNDTSVHGHGSLSKICGLQRRPDCRCIPGETQPDADPPQYVGRCKDPRPPCETSTGSRTISARFQRPRDPEQTS